MNPLRRKIQHTVGAKSSGKFTAGDAWDAWDKKFQRKSRKDWQSQLSKFATIMLTALLLLHNGFYRYSTIIFFGKIQNYLLSYDTCKCGRLLIKQQVSAIQFWFQSWLITQLYLLKANCYLTESYWNQLKKNLPLLSQSKYRIFFSRIIKVDLHYFPGTEKQRCGQAWY